MMSFKNTSSYSVSSLITFSTNIKKVHNSPWNGTDKASGSMNFFVGKEDAVGMDSISINRHALKVFDFT